MQNPQTRFFLKKIKSSLHTVVSRIGFFLQFIKTVSHPQSILNSQGKLRKRFYYHVVLCE